MEDYYIAQDESKAVAIKENGINHSENEKYYGSKANIKKVIERKGRVREQKPKLRIEVLESAEQCNEGYLRNTKPKKEKMTESAEQSRDDDFNEIGIYYTQGEPHIDSEKEINDSDEDDIILAKSIKQQNKRHVRKVRIINGRYSEFTYGDERDDFGKDEDHHETQTGLHELVERENINFTENRVDIKLISKKIYESGIPPVKINVEYIEKDEERDMRNLSIIKERCFDRDEKKHLSRHETYHDTSVDPITSSHETAVKEKVGSVENDKEIKMMSAKLDGPNILATEKKKDAEGPRKLRLETEMDPMENQTHNKVLSTNDTNLVEFIDSRRQENLESHDMNYKSLIENNEINVLPTGGFKSGNHHLRSGYNRHRSSNSANKRGLSCAKLSP